MSQTKYILSLDQGTTSSRAILFDNEQNIVCVQQREFEQIYPQQGWVEHNPMEIWSSQYGVTNEAMAQSGVDPGETLRALASPTSARPPSCGTANTGRPVYNAIVWQRPPALPPLDEPAEGPPAWRTTIRSKTGLLVDAYFSATKIKWILDNVPGAREKGRGRGAFVRHGGTFWLVWKLTAARCTLPTGTPTPAAPCCTTSTRWTGTTPCSRRWTSPAVSCPA